MAKSNPCQIEGNLELWVTSQPSGQRPDDLVVWAYEILERYAPRQFSA